MEEKHILERVREWCLRFGNIAVKKGFTTREQVKQALMEQIDDDLNDRPHRLIGKILSVKDWTTREQMDLVLKELFGKDPKGLNRVAQGGSER